MPSQGFVFLNDWSAAESSEFGFLQTSLSRNLVEQIGDREFHQNGNENRSSGPEDAVRARAAKDRANSRLNQFTGHGRGPDSLTLRGCQEPLPFSIGQSSLMPMIKKPSDAASCNQSAVNS